MSEPARTAEKPAGKAEDFIDVYVSPAELFRRRIDGKFGHALIVLIVLSAILFFITKSAMGPIYEAEFARGMAANPNLTPEQIEAGKKMAGVFGAVGVVVGIPIGALLLGLSVWLVGRILGATVNYIQGVTIATFAFFPRVIEGITNAVQALLLDESKLTSLHSVKLGVTRFLDPQAMGAVPMAFLGRVDLFTLWVTILIGVGLKQMGKIATGQAALGAVLVWLVGALPTLVPALMQK